MLYDVGRFINSLWHLMYIFSYCLEKGGLLIPGFTGHVKQTPGFSSEEELDWTAVWTTVDGGYHTINCGIHTVP